MKKRDDLALMQATIREQLELNNKLAFELGGLKWEVGFVRRLLRTILSFPTDRTETDAYTAEQYDGLCRARKDALAYLDGAPQEEDS